MKEFDLPVGWKYVSLADIANVINGVSFKPNDIKKEGIRILRSGNIQSGYLVLKDDDVFLDNTYYNRDNTLQYLDNCITASTGSIDVLGKCGTVFEEINNCQIGAFMRLVRSKSKDDALYISFILHSPLYYQYIRRLSKNGTSINNINNSHLEEFKFPLPPKNVKEEISKWYYSLEKKIALNTRMNAELEAMAKQLYDYWFVQFDFPDENGKPYKSSGGKMVYNPTLKREIPAGWEACTLGDFCDLYQPKTIGTDEMSKNGKYHVYGANGLIGFYDKYNHEKSEIVMACRGNSCGAINRTMPFSWITGNAMVLSVKDKSISNEFISQCTNYMNIKGAITGSGQPQLTRENLAPLLMIYPLQNILKRFSKKVTPIIEHRLHIQKTNEYLTHLRDSLLPMLMNGQVTVE
jgi:type I restriction enzyme S subunit